MTRIALDVMGGDGAPAVPIRGALDAVEGREIHVDLVGDPAQIEDVLKRDASETARARCSVTPASEAIRADEAPAMAVRRKRDSSIVVGIDLLRNGDADAFVSAGSTGAVMAASLLRLEPLPGVDRPAIGAVFPTTSHPTLVLDVGANVGCKPEHLHRFAHLGTIYVRDILGRQRPRVGLLNVGEEAGKGDEVVIAAHRLLSSDPEIRFVGNVEGNRIIHGACDVLVCDGFVGNALLKLFESVSGFVDDWLQRQPEGGAARAALGELLTVLDYAEYGGAPLLGVKGVSIVCHGASSPRAIKNAILFADRSVRSDMVRHMAREMERWMRAGGRA